MFTLCCHHCFFILYTYKAKLYFHILCSLSKAFVSFSFETEIEIENFDIFSRNCRRYLFLSQIFETSGNTTEYRFTGANYPYCGPGRHLVQNNAFRLFYFRKVAPTNSFDLPMVYLSIKRRREMFWCRRCVANGKVIKETNIPNIGSAENVRMGFTWKFSFRCNTLKKWRFFVHTNLECGGYCVNTKVILLEWTAKF